jgi:hypothetical protein
MGLTSRLAPVSQERPILQEPVNTFWTLPLVPFDGARYCSGFYTRAGCITTAGSLPTDRKASTAGHLTPLCSVVNG